MEERGTSQELMVAFHRLHRLKLNSGQIQGLNPGDLRVLRNIKHLDLGNGVMVSELSNLLQVSPSFITQISNGLVRQGLVNRAADPSDRRIVRLTVTPQGEDIIAKASQEYTALFDDLVRYLGQEQSKDLARLLGLVYQYFQHIEVNTDA